ncbi:hypothetical protein P8452_21375 [Trifolium repens]|nr:hypothetical protein P8452_21375 [Trifolium repens]
MTKTGRLNSSSLIHLFTFEILHGLVVNVHVLLLLCEPADSKMFMFGSLALEQFVDRLIEWPQYCNHILQISHLRSTHSEIVAFIEQALARISSGHTDVDGTSHTSVISNHSSAQAALGHAELSGSSMIQPGQQHLSLQLQQRRENPLDDRHKPLVGSSTDMRPPLASLGQSPVITQADYSSPIKIPSTVSASSMLSSSPGFVRPSRGTTSTRFGSALNIETLVAAAEKRETPIRCSSYLQEIDQIGRFLEFIYNYDQYFKIINHFYFVLVKSFVVSLCVSSSAYAPGSEVQDKISFIINNISSSNFEAKAKELTELLKEQYYPWFAQYMVQHANKVVNSQGSMVISKSKSHGTVSGGLQLKFKACWCG